LRRGRVASVRCEEQSSGKVVLLIRHPESDELYP
jgi:hypothetical protein